MLSKNSLFAPGLRLEEIARVEDGLKDPKSYSSYNGEEGVLLEIQKISGSNDLEVIKGVKKEMPELLLLASKHYTLQLVEDQSDKILINIDNVKFDLIYGHFWPYSSSFSFYAILRLLLSPPLRFPPPLSERLP